MARKTPIYESHVERGGRIVEFAGYEMPVSFEGIVAEHGRVRNGVGLFDVSHMGEIWITGDAARRFADWTVTNNVGKLDAGQICYTTCCNEEGHVLDDLLVYKFGEERILLVVNAANVDKIDAHLRDVVRWDVHLENRTLETGQIAVQGPASRELLMRIQLCAPIRDEIETMPYYRFVSFEKNGAEVLVSRTGYTGELGYEIYLPAHLALDAWNELLEAGTDLGVAPIGLGARDTLRFEPCYCLYGNELDEKTSPLEAGLSWVVKLKKGDFIGRDALAAEKEAGPPRSLVGFEIEGRGIARHGFPVMLGGETVGAVTSGTFGPTLGKSLALALVSSAAATEEEGFTVDIRGRAVPAARVRLPFYKSRSMD
ncbi:MAG: glycine cleavage system aminomethyltransferase GcvT [Candidatus Krumholzibacteriota bacterium]|nr:glycine cleavage system aminomethyltransferase GcvT [Candidatus Krumholzibacteriota bacterium]